MDKQYKYKPESELAEMVEQIAKKLEASGTFLGTKDHRNGCYEIAPGVFTGKKGVEQFERAVADEIKKLSK